MHYIATVWIRCHSDCTTHLWEGVLRASKGQLCHCSAVTFFSCIPLLPVCASCLTLLLYIPTRYLWLASLHLSPWLRRGRQPCPHHCWVGVVLQPWSSLPPKHLHCHSRARDELQVLQHSDCPIQDIHQHGPAAYQSCSRCLWVVAQALQDVKKPVFLEGPAAVRAGFTRSKAEGKDPRQTARHNHLAEQFLYHCQIQMFKQQEMNPQNHEADTTLGFF